MFISAPSSLWMTYSVGTKQSLELVYVEILEGGLAVGFGQALVILALPFRLFIATK